MLCRSQSTNHVSRALNFLRRIPTHKRKAIACGSIYDFNFSQRETHKENCAHVKQMQRRRMLGENVHVVIKAHVKI